MIQTAEALASARRRLTSVPQANPELEARLLLAEVLDKPPTHLLAWPEKALTDAQAERYERLLRRRLGGEPIAYITGEREFWSLPLEVTPDTLIPRPETEQLVELALQHIPPRAKWRIADLGTGSGAIAAAIASERSGCRVVATDLSAAALAVAKRNFERLGLTHITTVQGSWFEALHDAPPFDLILTNPPYISRHDPHLRQGDLPSEPALALVAGGDGLDAIRIIARQAPCHLAKDGRLMLEHGFDQGSAARRLLVEAGFSETSTHRDLAGNERITTGLCPSR